MRGSGFRIPSTADSTTRSKRCRSDPALLSSATQLFVMAAAMSPFARMRRMASSIVGRGAVAPATRSMSVRAESLAPAAAHSRSNAS